MNPGSSKDAQTSLRELPPLNDVLAEPACATWIEKWGRSVVVSQARKAIETVRKALASNDVPQDRRQLTACILESMRREVGARHLRSVQRVINATGVVLHTNLGRAPLADAAICAVKHVAQAGNVEMDLVSGDRRYRGYQIEELWRELTGAEDCLVVNNCAAATLLSLQAVGAGREVIVSRGQLIEIGGSYRLPDVFRQSGARLIEVGTTNRTRLSDYENAVTAETAAVLRVHPSNFRVQGFTESVEIAPMVDLARSRGILCIDDLGSGSLMDLSPFGLPGEPIVGESINAGADLVLFSGDKLLGGPQAGVILGRKSAISRLRGSPLARALRIDKLTLAALQATLQIYQRGKPFEEIPVLRQLTEAPSSLRARADRLAALFPLSLHAEVQAGKSAVGGGSLPTVELDTWVVALRSPGQSADEWQSRLRAQPVPIITRIVADAVVFDLRTIFPADEGLVAEAVCRIVPGNESP